MKKSETSPFLCNYLIKCTAISRSKRPDIEARWSSKYQIVASPTCKNYFVAHLYGREISLRYGLDSILVFFRGQGITLGRCFMIGQNRKQRWRHEAYKFSHPTAGKFKSSNCLQFYATLDRLIGRKLFICWSVLGSPRKQAGGKISEIVSESKE